ncbi:Extracellular globin-3 [Lamellibrachia satsuma]|nr:Extracellular globin-3 [Lamellibrachia satsuma]
MRQLVALLVLSCGLSACTASLEQCSIGDARTVMKQWRNVINLGSDSQTKLTGGRAVFNGLFDRAPAARALFKRLNVEDFEGPEFSGHIMRVMSGLDMLINYLDNRPTLEKMLSHLSDQHVVRTGVTAAAFDLMAEVLLGGLPVVIDNFDSMAWCNCIRPILKGMSAGLP